VTKTKTEGRVPGDLEDAPVEVGVCPRVELIVDGLARIVVELERVVVELERVVVELERVVVELERVVVELERVANGPPLP
jgi:hypothetical protein